MATMQNKDVRAKVEVSLSAFALLFSELVQYSQSRVISIDDLQKRLEDAGFGVGVRLHELVCARERIQKRETRLLGMLQFIHTTVWKNIFGRTADSLERSVDNADEYMIRDANPITNTFVSVPADMAGFNCAAYIAGIIAGILHSAHFPSRVTAHTTDQATVFLIKFDQSVMEREARLGGS